MCVCVCVVLKTEAVSLGKCSVPDYTPIIGSANENNS